MTLRTLMVGLDALEVTVVDRLLAEGRLPNLARFAARAVRLEISSDGANLHGTLWPTFAAGVGPGWHGIYQWMQWIAEEMRHRRNDHPSLHFDPFWAAISDAGHAVSALDVPFVPPVFATNARTIIGWGLHDEVRRRSDPKGLMRAANHRVGRHPLSIDVVEPFSPSAKRQMARDMVRGLAMRSRLLRALAARSTFLVVTFAEFHKAGHYLARDMDLGDGLTSARVYDGIVEAFDAQLPKILELAGDECDVYLFSLHGVREQVPYEEFGAQILEAFAGREPTDREPRPDLLRRVRGLVPARLHEPIWRRVPAGLRAAREAARWREDADYQSSRLFRVFYDGHPGVRINLRGRESPGLVDVADRERVLQELGTFASRLVADDGQPAFTELWDVQQARPGPRAHRLPDALLIANFDVKATHNLRGADGLVLRSARPEARSGVHTGKGFAFIRPGDGAKVLRDTIVPEDFAPTVLSRFGLARTEVMQGERFLG